MTLRDAFYFTAGIGFLALAKGKHSLQGYTSPKPFDISETDRCIDYDQRVVDGWLQQLGRYCKSDGGAESLLAGRNVLELGPGSDLGVGMLLLARGAAKYNACDVNNLVGRTPGSFYDALLAQLRSSHPDRSGLIRAELDKQRAGQPSLLNYVVRPDFDLEAALGASCIELVFSQAAFEHFDDIDSMVRQLTRVCRPGALIVAEIDLKTHSRWIRDHDPNNIYRYPDGLYDLFWFRGIPNRVRPHEYAAAFARHGWEDIRIHALATTAGPSGGLWNKRFRGAENRMDYLSIMFCARRGSRK